MPLLFLIGAVQSFFLAIILQLRDSKTLRDHFLIAWMIFLGVHLGSVYAAASGIYRHYPQWFGWDAAFILLEGPFLYLYVALATNRINKLKPIYLFHALPYFIFTAYLQVKVHQYHGNELYLYISSLLSDDSNIMLGFLGLLNHLHLIIYLVLSILMLRQHQRTLKEQFSYLDEINLRWLWSIVIGLGVVSAFILLGLVINDLFQFVSHNFKAYMIYAAFSVLPFYLAYMAIQQKIVYAPVTTAYKRYEDSDLDRDNSGQLAIKLEVLMKESKPYLNGKLSLNELALKLNITSRHLSQVINENFECNFFTYINQYRVEEAKAILANKESRNLKLMAVALDCGFNTKASFNSVFKKLTGLTPSEYLEQHQIANS